MSLASINNFLSWFEEHGGQYDKESVGFAEIEGFGRATVALKDIEEGVALFTFSPSLTLSTKTSKLPSLVGAEQWRQFELHRGWVGLILCMLWEAARGSESKWFPYLDSLPTEFHTPMFWGEDELKELRGTDIADKVGREDAERHFAERLLPAVKSRPDLFPPEDIARIYNLENYHIMGSRILSRSFHNEGWDYGDSEDEDQQLMNTSADMDVDEAPPLLDPAPEAEDEGERSDSEEEEEEDGTAMVPFADLLNARYGCSNSKLEYDDETGLLTMLCTKDIKTGDQIWNTYADPPNSDLLRRYGHVDVLPMGDGQGGNPADVVELRADTVIDACGLMKDDLMGRIEWWLDIGEDDVFELNYSLEIPKDLVSFIRMVHLDVAEWNGVKDKGKAPKGKPDSDLLKVIQKALERRSGYYPTTLEEDRARLATLTSGSMIPQYGSPSYHVQCALVVRIGEKTILYNMQNKIAGLMDLTAPLNGAGERSKRPREEGSGKRNDAKKARN